MNRFSPSPAEGPMWLKALTNPLNWYQVGDLESMDHSQFKSPHGSLLRMDGTASMSLQLPSPVKVTFPPLLGEDQERWEMDGPPECYNQRGLGRGLMGTPSDRLVSRVPHRGKGPFKETGYVSPGGGCWTILKGEIEREPTEVRIEPIYSYSSVGFEAYTLSRVHPESPTKDEQGVVDQYNNPPSLLYYHLPEYAELAPIKSDPGGGTEWDA
ncbi:hypothetical protein G9A89_000205 [Geosiphon pyriformis]|nr:hypothetical protein G9A89_000205 [Geosiphon pyriformis]